MHERVLASVVESAQARVYVSMNRMVAYAVTSVDFRKLAFGVAAVRRTSRASHDKLCFVGDRKPTSAKEENLSYTQEMAVAGIRGFEIDTLDDPTGGKYAYSAALKLTKATSTLISPDLLKPGIKVHYCHVLRGCSSLLL